MLGRNVKATTIENIEHNVRLFRVAYLTQTARNYWKLPEIILELRLSGYSVIQQWSSPNIYMITKETNIDEAREHQKAWQKSNRPH